METGPSQPGAAVHHRLSTRWLGALSVFFRFDEFHLLPMRVLVYALLLLNIWLAFVPSPFESKKSTV